MATLPSGNPATPAVPAFRFGPSALLTPANLVTLLRFALTLPLLTVISAEGPSWRAWVGWVIIGSTDGLDGWLARRDGTTRSGAFLDPLADKFLAIGGLVALASQEIFPWLAVVLITARELTVSAYRTWAGRRGVSIPARWLGKVKTISQLVAVGVALCPLTDQPPWLGLDRAVGGGGAHPGVGSRPAPEPVARRCGDATDVRCDVLAVGTELLLGQLVDTNSAWIGEQLAAVGIDSHLHVVVGDNQDRVVEIHALAAGAQRCAARVRRARPHARRPHPGGHRRGDGGRTGPPRAPRRPHPGDVHEPGSAHVALQRAPGRRPRKVAGPSPIRSAPPRGWPAPWTGRSSTPCPACPYEMQAMVTGDVIPDLLERSGERATILSRSLRTWGSAESTLAERIAGRVDAQTNPTIAFLARGIEGLYVRITAKAPSGPEALKLIEAEETELRAVLGDLIFGVDDESMEAVVLGLLRDRGWTLAVAESVTGGLVGARLVDAPGASDTFRGGVVTYATDVKRSLLGVTAEKVVSGECAIQMAEGRPPAAGG